MRYLLVLLLLPFSLLANVASVTQLKGKAWLIRDNKKINLRVDSLVQEIDHLYTSKRSRLQLKFLDDTVITLGQQSDLNIHQYLIDANNSNVNLSMNKGFFRTITGQIGKLAPGKFSFSLRNATIGIRGTDFAGLIDKDKMGVLYIGKGDGVVVKHHQDRHLAKPGEGVIINNAQLTPRVNRWTTKEIDSIFRHLDEKPVHFAHQDLLSWNIDFKSLHSDRTFNDDSTFSSLFNLKVPYSNHFSFNMELLGAALTKIYLDYEKGNHIAHLGQFHYQSPLTGYKRFYATQSYWKDESDNIDWVWFDATSFTGASYAYNLLPHLLVEGTVLTAFKAANQKTYNDLSEINIVSNQANSNTLAIAGLRYKDTIHAELFSYYLHDTLFAAYAEADFPISNELQVSTQLLYETSQELSSDIIDANLLGIEALYSTPSSSLALAYTQANGATDVATPWQGDPAFTNSLINSNHLGVYGTHTMKGPYAQGTRAYKVSASHILHSFAHLQLHASLGYYYQNSDSMQEINYELRQRFPIAGYEFSYSLRFANIDNFNYSGNKENFYLLLTNWHF
jgi:hypothetical protein